jgi:hypothetical protein
MIAMTRNRVGGSVAALVVLYGTPTIVYLVAATSPYAVLLATLLVTAAWLVRRLLWPQQSSIAGVAHVGAAALIAAATAVIGFLAEYAAILSAGLCGSDGTSTPIAGSIVATAVYGVIGVWGFQQPRRVLWAWAFAIAIAVVVDFAVTAAIPSAHGYCET